MSEGALARGLRNVAWGATLAVVPEESGIANQLRSLINRNRLTASAKEKAVEDQARLQLLLEVDAGVLERLELEFGGRGNWLPAKRLQGEPGDEVPRSMLVDRGQVQGVGVQNLAFTPDGFAGTVALAEDHQCLVMLLSDEQFKIAARVEGFEESGLLCGLAPNQIEGEPPLLLLKYLSRYTNPEPGTEVRSSGVGGLYPANLLLGKIHSFSAGDLYGEALVIPQVDFAGLETLLLTRGLMPE